MSFEFKHWIGGCTTCDLAENYLKLQILKAIEKTNMTNPLDYFLEQIWEDPLPEEYYTTPTTIASLLFDDDAFSDIDWGDWRRRKRELNGPCKMWDCLTLQNFSKADIHMTVLKKAVSI